LISLYATQAAANIYHLVNEPFNLTVCGLRVTKVSSGVSLHLIKMLPTDHILCKHCERLESKERV